MMETYQSAVMKVHTTFADQVAIACVHQLGIVFVPRLCVGFDARHNILGVEVLIILKSPLILGGQRPDNTAADNCV